MKTMERTSSLLPESETNIQKLKVKSIFHWKCWLPFLPRAFFFKTFSARKFSFVFYFSCNLPISFCCIFPSCILTYHLIINAVILVLLIPSQVVIHALPLWPLSIPKLSLGIFYILTHFNFPTTIFTFILVQWPPCV